MNLTHKIPELILEKSILGLDYGKKRIGLATYRVGDDPFPLKHKTIINNNLKQVLHEIDEAVIQEDINLIVVGLPTYLNGQDSEWTKEVRQFKQILQQNYTFPIYFQDENLTSFEATKRMQESPEYSFRADKKQIDMLSACIIIEDFINNL